MKSRKFIFSHAAVFAVGAAMALVSYGPLAKHLGGDGDAAAGAQSNRAGAGSASDESATAPRDRHDAKSSKLHSNEPPIKRMAGIVRIADPLERQLALMELLSRLGPNDFAAVADQLLFLRIN